LPDDRAWPGQQTEQPAEQGVGQRTARPGGQRAGQWGVPPGGAVAEGWAGAVARDPSGGRRPVRGAIPLSTTQATAVDPWPALPDDGPLWALPTAAWDTAQLARLEREQAGD
ncbi:hypothetical protein, partial [Micromonospora sp. ALFpr18c]